MHKNSWTIVSSRPRSTVSKKVSLRKSAMTRYVSLQFRKDMLCVVAKNRNDTLTVYDEVWLLVDAKNRKDTLTVYDEVWLLVDAVYVNLKDKTILCVWCKTIYYTRLAVLWNYHLLFLRCVPHM